MSLISKTKQLNSRVNRSSVNQDSENDILLCKDDKQYVYFASKNDPKISTSKEINSDTGFTPVPYLNKKSNQRSAVFISGVSGSGKSTIARKLIDEFISLQKPKLTCLFTQTPDLDPAFEDLAEKSSKKKKPDFVHVDLKNDPLLFTLTPESLRDCLVIFDDFENLPKAIDSFVQTFIKDILERGRKLHINVILITHQTMNYNKTRPIIFECDTFVLFPSTNPNAVKKFLLSYGDLDKEQIDEMIKSSSNMFDYLIFRKSYPRYFLNKSSIKLI